MTELRAVLKGWIGRSRDADYKPEPTPPPPACDVCGGHGWVRHNVPHGHEDFGRAFPCRCHKRTNGKLHREDLLHILRPELLRAHQEAAEILLLDCVSCRTVFLVSALLNHRPLYRSCMCGNQVPLLDGFILGVWDNTGHYISGPEWSAEVSERIWRQLVRRTG